MDALPARSGCHDAMEPTEMNNSLLQLARNQTNPQQLLAVSITACLHFAILELQQYKDTPIVCAIFYKFIIAVMPSSIANND